MYRLNSHLGSKNGTNDVFTMGPGRETPGGGGKPGAPDKM